MAKQRYMCQVCGFNFSRVSDLKSSYCPFCGKQNSVSEYNFEDLFN